jgi:hypothetical protein
MKQVTWEEYLNDMLELELMIQSMPKHLLTGEVLSL